MKKNLFISLVLSLSAAIAGCGQNHGSETTTPPAPPPQEAPSLPPPPPDFSDPSVRTAPRFPGGNDSLREFISTHINRRAPKNPQQMSEDVIFVQFTIAADGKVTDVSLDRPSKRADHNKEAIRVVKLLPTWIPGTEHGKPVPVPYSIPITFWD